MSPPPANVLFDDDVLEINILPPVESSVKLVEATLQASCNESVPGSVQRPVPIVIARVKVVAFAERYLGLTV